MSAPVRQTITAAEFFANHYFDRRGGSWFLTLACGHNEVRKCSALPSPVVGTTKAKCGRCTQNWLGDCRDETAIENLFGSVSEFARLVEEKGNDFTHGKTRVSYDAANDRHSFFNI